MMRHSLTTRANQTDGWMLYTGILTLFGVITAGGYIIFRVFATTVMPDLSAYNLLALSIIAGVASFFSPCAFPLLPGYFSLYYAEAENTGKAKLSLAAASGVISFNLILGVIIGVVGTGLAQGLSITGDQAIFTRAFRSLVGIVLIFLGIAQFRGVNLKPLLADHLAWRTRPHLENKNPTRSLYFYGLGYNAAGMGCTGPILAGLVIFALSSGGLVSALLAFGIFSMTMGSLMLLVSVLVATSQEAMIYRLKKASPRIKTLTGILLVGVGLFNIITSIETDTFINLLFP
ncbi:MAG: hypothetical protein L0154_19405 [Chloroflexi bacterium]|nr:hypothetical protein [Chloroflexota bacterium]